MFTEAVVVVVAVVVVEVVVVAGRREELGADTGRICNGQFFYQYTPCHYIFYDNIIKYTWCFLN